MAANPKLTEIKPLDSEKFKDIKGKRAKVGCIDEFNGIDEIDKREIIKEKSEQASKFLSKMSAAPGDSKD